MHELSLVVADSIRLLTALFLAAVDHVVFGWEVPYNDLPIKATTNEHIRIIRMPLDRGHLDRCVQQIC